MHRRDFLKRMTAGGLGLAAGATPWRARAAPAWGDTPAAQQSVLLPPERQAKQVLDIFLYGGLCPWETLYVVPEHGHPDDPDYPGEQWWTFQDGPGSVAEVYATCHGASAPPLLKEFRLDANGMLVHLGPFMEPLRSRKDIVERLRVHVLTHSLEPHEGAIPLALSGFRLGHPKLAGVGAAVQHFHQAHAAMSTGEPYAYVLYSPGDYPTDNLRAASAVGAHPGSSRPLAIRVEPGAAFVEALQRKTVASAQPHFDALLDHYASVYDERLRAAVSKELVRSSTRTDYRFALASLQESGALVGLLGPEYFQSVAGTACGQSAEPSYPHMGLRLAAHLLTAPGSQARYVCVVDGGLIPASGGGGYDTHNNHVADSARNLTNLWTNLSAILNEPGEDDPGKLNLDETLVCINTEFGRTPGSQNGDGRNHHPYAYTTAMFGGPIGPDQQGIVGSIGPDALPVSALSPAEPRAAILSALGIYPFAPECYAVSDVSSASNETDAAAYLLEGVLGVKV